MLEPLRNFSYENYRFGFNDEEKIDEALGTGNCIDFGARNFDSRVGRWWSTDPLQRKFVYNAPYLGFSDDPLNRIDPTGKGDFYSQSGKKVGTDGHSDGEIYIVTDKNALKLIQKNTKDGVFTQVNDVQSSTIKLPNAEIRWSISKSVDRSNRPSLADVKGGFHEEGGIWGIGYDNKEKVVDAKPGPYSNPSEQKEAHIDVWDSQDPSQSLRTVEGTFHVHPSGEISSTDNNLPQGSSGQTIGATTTTSYFDQPPSDVDIQNAGKETQSGDVKGNSIVIGARSKTVYIYNGSGTQATFPLDLFRNLGNEDKKESSQPDQQPH